jgi:hypothetical protein
MLSFASSVNIFFSDYLQTPSARLNSPASARLSFMTNLYPIVNRFFYGFEKKQPFNQH